MHPEILRTKCPEKTTVMYEWLLGLTAPATNQETLNGWVSYKLPEFPGCLAPGKFAGYNEKAEVAAPRSCFSGVWSTC